jgi:hypothetical protein
MDVASKHAAQFFDAMAAANERLVALARALRPRPLVAQVLDSVALRSYRTGAALDCYVEATSVTNDAICYWLQLSRAETEWLIETSVTINRAEQEYQDVLKEFPERRAASLKAVIEQLDEAVSDLVAASEDIHPHQVAVG